MWYDWIFLMVLVAFIIVVVVGFLRWFVTRHRPPLSTKEDALDILKKRYAQGEITEEEFEEKKKQLLS